MTTDSHQDTKAEKIQELQLNTLSGDIADRILHFAKALPKPWPQMSEAQQHDYVEVAMDIGADTVREMLGIVAGKGMLRFRGTLDNVGFKGDAAKAVVKLSAELEHIEQLALKPAHAVELVCTEIHDYLGQRPATRVLRDQPTMEFGETPAPKNSPAPEREPVEPVDGAAPEPAQNEPEEPENRPASPSEEIAANAALDSLTSLIEGLSIEDKREIAIDVLPFGKTVQDALFVAGIGDAGQLSGFTEAQLINEVGLAPSEIIIVQSVLKVLFKAPAEPAPAKAEPEGAGNEEEDYLSALSDPPPAKAPKKRGRPKKDKGAKQPGEIDPATGINPDAAEPQSPAENGEPGFKDVTPRMTTEEYHEYLEKQGRTIVDAG